jgi:MFS family permease
VSDLQSPVRKKSETRKLLEYVTAEGCLANAYTVLTDVPYLVAYALLLNASNTLVAVIGGLPWLMRIFNLAGAYWVEKSGNRKLVSIISGGLSRELWLVVVIVSLFFADWTSETKLMIFTVVVFVSYAAAMVLNNSWMSWMSDAIPSEIRQKYFGFRNSLMALVSILTSLFVGLVLDGFKTSPMLAGIGHAAEVGFAITFFIAAAGGFVTLILFYKQYEPPFVEPLPLTMREKIMKPLRDKNYQRILIFFFVWNVSVGLGSVFFTVEMINGLKMSLFQVALYTLIVTAGGVITNPIWGKVASMFGAGGVLKLTAIFIAITPLLWLFATPTFLAPVWLDAIISSVAWTGFNLAVVDIQFAESQAEGRPYYFSAYAILSGVGFFAASLASGILIDRLAGFSVPSLTGGHLTGHHVMFFLSSMGRFASVIVFIRLRRHTAENPKAVAAYLQQEMINQMVSYVNLGIETLVIVARKGFPKR